MSDLLKKRNKNSLLENHNKVEPVEAFDRQKLFSGKEISSVTKEKKDNSTGTRIDRDVLRNLKALKTIDDSPSISEVIQSMIYLRENKMSDDERRQYELLKSVLK